MNISKGGTQTFEIKPRTKRCARVAAADSVVVPARSEYLLPGKFKDRPLEGDGVLKQDETFLKRHELLLARSLVNSKSSVLFVRLLNPGTEDVEIHVGTVIALFEHVSSNEPEQVCNVQLKQDTFPSHLEEPFEQNTIGWRTEESDAFRELLVRKQEAFAGPCEKGHCNLGKHVIKLTDETPIKDAPRRIPMYKRDAVMEQIQKLEEKV